MESLRSTSPQRVEQPVTAESSPHESHEGPGPAPSLTGLLTLQGAVANARYVAARLPTFSSLRAIARPTSRAPLLPVSEKAPVIDEKALAAIVQELAQPEPVETHASSTLLASVRVKGAKVAQAVGVVGSALCPRSETFTSIFSTMGGGVTAALAGHLVDASSESMSGALVLGMAFGLAMSAHSDQKAKTAKQALATAEAQVARLQRSLAAHEVPTTVCLAEMSEVRAASPSRRAPQHEAGEDNDSSAD